MDFFKNTTYAMLHMDQVRAVRRGFSLVELMVSVAIVLAIATVILVRYSTFNSAVLLQNTAFEVAITLREAQVLSVSVLGDSSGFSGVYGLYADISASGNQNEYILFRDTDGDEAYDDDGSEDFNIFNINQNFILSDICVDGVCGSEEITVTFERPDFDARFAVDGGSIDPGIAEVLIEVASSEDPSFTREVRIGATGQISVQ